MIWLSLIGTRLWLTVKFQVNQTKGLKTMDYNSFKNNQAQSGTLIGANSIEKEIARAARDIDNTIGRLENISSTLLEKLQPVLTQEEKSEGIGAAPRVGASSKFGQSLQEQDSRLISIECRLNDILDRLAF